MNSKDKELLEQAAMELVRAVLKGEYSVARLNANNVIALLPK